MTMKAITFYTIIFIYSVHRVCHNKFHMKNLTLNSDKINGSGILESPCYANSKIEGRFYIGAYTFISNLSKIRNCFIGRFSRIDENCLIGLNKEKKDHSVIISSTTLRMAHLLMMNITNPSNPTVFLRKR